MTNFLFAPANNANLVVLRVFFGFLLVCEAWGAIATGWVYRSFVEPSFTFNFIGLDFLQFFIGKTMYIWFIVMGLAAWGVLLGWHYRKSMLLFALLWTGCYLMQKSHYNNHYYLVVLLSWLFVFLPANARFSLDAVKKRVTSSRFCPNWVYFLLISQLFIVYSFAAIAKIYPDWLQGEPLGMWLRSKTSYPFIGWIYGIEGMNYVLAYGGILFDGLVIPFLLWKKTRRAAIVLSIVFHLINAVTFQIGIFPFMMIGFLILFVEAEWVERRFKLSLNNPSFFSSEQKNGFYRSWIALPLTVYLLIQIALPLRHHFFEGNVHWTEEGHRMAWQMMLRSKSGTLHFRIKNLDNGKQFRIYPTKEMTRSQARAMSKRPDMVWQFVQRIKTQQAAEGRPNIEIYAQGKLSLNGHKAQNLIDPNYDLAKAEWHRFRHSEWVLDYVFED